jgi:hypothetical protein
VSQIPIRKLRIEVGSVFAVALCAVCLIVAFWKITLTRQYTFIERPDIGHQVLPWLQVQAAALHNGELPLWDPYMLGGQTLVGQVQPAVFSPITWVLLAAPLDASGHLGLGWVHAWYVLLHALGALFAYLFLRSLAASRMASVVGAVFFATAGFLGHVAWPQIAAGAVWLPLVFLFYLRSLRGESATVSALCAGAFLALSVLAGHHAVPMFAVLALGGLGLTAVLCRWLTVQAAVLRTALTLLVTVAGAAVQILPALEYARYAMRWVNAPNPVTGRMPVPYPVHEMLGWKASELLFLIVPGSQAIVNPLVGIVPLALAAAAVLSLPRRRDTGLFVGTAMAALLFSLVRLNPLHGVLYAIVPELEKARAPIMAMAVADVALAALVAFGTQAILKGPGSRLYLVYRGAAAIGAILFLMSLYPPPLLKGIPDDTERIAGVALVAMLLALLLYSWERGHVGPRVMVAAILVLGLFEGHNSSGSEYVHVDDQASVVRPRLYGGMSDVVKFLKEHAGVSRVSYTYDDLIFNFGDWYGIQAMSGFVPSAPEAVWRLGLWNPRVLDLYGARYQVGRKPSPDAGREVFSSSQGWKVWERPTAFPRAWVVHNVTVARSREEATQMVLAPAVNLRELVILDRQAPTEACSDQGNVQLDLYQNQRVALTAELSCAGVLVLSDNWFPGWNATLDGRPVPILVADGALRAIAVPMGKHRVEMRYSPASIRWGGAVSFVTFLSLAAIVLTRRRYPTARRTSRL